MLREFRLSPKGSGRGISCDESGAFVGAIPLLEKSVVHGKDRWQPRNSDELSKQLGSHFGLPVDISPKAGRLKAIANALSKDDLARAQIATVLLGIPEPPALSKGTRTPQAIIEFIRDLYWSGLIKWSDDEGALLKAGYNPDEPRDEHGRLTTDGSDGTGDSDAADAFLRYSIREGILNDGVYHPESDPVELEETASSPEQLRLNRLVHDEQVQREMRAWRKKGFVPIPNVTFEDPRTGTIVVADYVVSAWVPDPMSFGLFPKLEPFLVRDVKTGGGGLTENQKKVYPYILAGGEVVPVGDNAALAGFEADEPTVIAEMYVGRDLPGDAAH